VRQTTSLNKGAMAPSSVDSLRAWVASENLQVEAGTRLAAACRLVGGLTYQQSSFEAHLSVCITQVYA
jgi:hypothetical protein